MGARGTFLDGIMIIAYDEANDAYTQHNFDSADGNTIDGKWETSHNGGETWDLDFNLVYTRLT